MKGLFSVWMLIILAFCLLLSATPSVLAQSEIIKRLPKECITKLETQADLLKNGGAFSNIFNISLNLPFVPNECALDDPNGDVKNPAKATTAIPVKYFPFVLFRVYRFLISLAFYLFGLGLIVTGVLIQTNVIAGNYDFTIRIKKYLNRSIVGIATVLFAYYIVAIILWIFNVDSILNEQIITGG